MSYPPLRLKCVRPAQNWSSSRRGVACKKEEDEALIVSSFAFYTVLAKQLVIFNIITQIGGVNLLRIPSKDAYAYDRALLDQLYTNHEQKQSIVLSQKNLQREWNKCSVSPTLIQIHLVGTIQIGFLGVTINTYFSISFSMYPEAVWGHIQSHRAYQKLESEM